MNELPQSAKTTRLKLRFPIIEDAVAIFEQYAQDEEVTKYMTWQPHFCIQDTQTYLQRCLDELKAKTAFFWVILPKEESKPIGMIRLQLQGCRAELNYVLARSYWNQGLMSEVLQFVANEAIAQSNIYRVWAVCDRENLASARVLEKIGMTREGILRRWLIYPNLSNNPRDCICYAKVK